MPFRYDVTDPHSDAFIHSMVQQRQQQEEDKHNAYREQLQIEETFTSLLGDLDSLDIEDNELDANLLDNGPNLFADDPDLDFLP